MGDLAVHGHEVYPSDVPSLGYTRERRQPRDADTGTGGRLSDTSSCGGLRHRGGGHRAFRTRRNHGNQDHRLVRRHRERHGRARARAAARPRGRLARARLRPPRRRAGRRSGRSSHRTKRRSCWRTARAGSATRTCRGYVVSAPSTPGRSPRPRRARGGGRDRLRLGVPHRARPRSPRARRRSGCSRADRSRSPIAPAGMRDHGDLAIEVVSAVSEEGDPGPRGDGGLDRRRVRRDGRDARRRRDGTRRRRLEARNRRGPRHVSAAAQYLIEMLTCPVLVLPHGSALRFDPPA